MKLFYLANIRLPTEKAHGLQIMKTCEALAAAGAEVELVVPTRRTLIQDDPFAYYGVARTFTVRKVWTPDFTRFGRLGFVLSALWFAEASHFCRSFWRADVVYSRDALVLAQYVLLGRPLVYEAHTTPTAMTRLVARRAKRVITITQGLKDAYIAAGVPSERIAVVPDAVDLTAFDHPEPQEAARVRLGLPLDKKIALYAGRLDGWKGVDTLLKASKPLPPSVLVAIIGGEAQQIAALSVQYPSVRFLGYRPYSELPNNQAAADVLVLPNTGKNIDALRFTSPLKLFTYMASGVPIVTSDTPAVREVLTEAEAYFFEPDNPEALVRAVQTALDEPEEARQKAEQAQRKARAYTWKQRAAHILESLS